MQLNLSAGFALQQCSRSNLATHHGHVSLSLPIGTYADVPIPTSCPSVAILASATTTPALHAEVHPFVLVAVLHSLLWRLLSHMFGAVAKQ